MTTLTVQLYLSDVTEHFEYFYKDVCLFQILLCCTLAQLFYNTREGLHRKIKKCA